MIQQNKKPSPVIKQQKPYIFPPLDLLAKNQAVQSNDSKAEMLVNAKKLENTLRSFGVEAKVIQINKGPTVTRYELSPSQGVKVSKIVNLADDIALNLAASDIRIEAPIPGKAAVGIEVPNKEAQSVFLRSVLESEAFQKFPSKLAFALGEDIAGQPIVADIAKMPHLLIAGATGSGKSVCINTLITSILYKADPKEVKLLLVDPKVVELSVYNGIPHLLIPVVTDPKKASAALNWAVREMLERYNDFAENGVRDIKGYNAMKKEQGETENIMPQIVIIIDELADLMMAAPGEVEDAICRLAQMARAAGMHLIIATQRPSVDVITGVIKANIPSRLAFAVSSGIDSRTILDMVGAETSFNFMQDKIHIELVRSLTKNNTTYTDINLASLALGGLTQGVSTYDMAAAYSTFARQGTYIAPKTYTMVTDNNGQVLLRNESEEETILAERTTYYITEMLQQVVTGGSGATGKAANFSGQEIAGKTGTTTSRRDLWFVGYTPYYTAAVWTGYDQQERLSSSLGNPSTGLWRQVMSAVHQNLAYKDFTQPDSSNLRTVTYCLSSGMLATSACGSNVATGTFYADDVPTGSCTYHRVTVPTTDPDTGATGDETGDNTDPGTTDPGTDPGTDTPPTTDPGTDPTTPPAEGGTETTGRRRRNYALRPVS